MTHQTKGCEEIGREISDNRNAIRKQAGRCEEAALSFSEHGTCDLGPEQCMGVRNRGRRVSGEGARSREEALRLTR